MASKCSVTTGLWRVCLSSRSQQLNVLTLFMTPVQGEKTKASKWSTRKLVPLVRLPLFAHPIPLFISGRCCNFGHHSVPCSAFPMLALQHLQYSSSPCPVCRTTCHRTRSSGWGVLLSPGTVNRIICILLQHKLLWPTTIKTRRDAPSRCTRQANLYKSYDCRRIQPAVPIRLAL